MGADKPLALPSGWDAMLAVWRSVAVPDGWRVEIVGESIVASPPDKRQSMIAAEVNRALLPTLPPDVGSHQRLAVAHPEGQLLFVPDLVVMPRAALHGRDDDPVPADRALLAVEITSPTSAETDRFSKLVGYGAARVPLYLLIDRFDETGPTVTLFAKPTGASYKHAVGIPFGDVLRLGAPFDVELDTRDF